MGDLKKRVLAGLLLMMIVVALPSIGMAGKQDFTLVNNSPYAIVGLWVAPADSDNWEENCLVQNSSTDICSRRIQKVAKKKCRCLQQCRKTNAS